MGGVLSCFQSGSSEEEESLLRGQQAGYNTGVDDIGDDYHALQQQKLEQERKAQARENELRDIVNNTNDKLIDISMISNSGIVVQSNDITDHTGVDSHDALEVDDTDDSHINTGTSNLAAIMSSGASISNNNNNMADDHISAIHNNHNTAVTVNFVPMDSKTQMSTETKNSLKQMHAHIEQSLQQQLTIESPGNLTMAF